MKGSWLLAAILITAVAGPQAVAIRRPVAPPAPAARRVDHVDQAAAENDMAGAMRAWSAAHRAAVASRRWQDLIEVADAYRRIGAASTSSEPFDATARRIYLAAVERARRDGSVDGVIRAGDALSDLGDVAGVARSLRIARTLASRDPDAQADVRAFAARVADLVPP